MHTVELYAHVRRYVAVDHHSQREAARHFGISRDMVAKMMENAQPPGYRRTAAVARPKLDPFMGWITETLKGDQQKHRKQRHTAQRIFERLKAEHGYTGGYTVIKDVVREHERRHREMFVPLVRPPGHAQVDFGEAVVIVGGVEQKGHFLAMDLPHSDAPFVMVFPKEKTEAFCLGHAEAFAWFGGVPQSILYDNTSIAVARILDDGERVRTQVFGQLLSHYLFRDRFARVGKVNDKGNVEGLVKYTQRTILTPIPEAADWETLNLQVRERCRQRRKEHVRGSAGTIGERMAADVAAFLPLPAAPFDCCRLVPGRVSSQSLVRFETNDYSVPVAFGHRQVLIKAYVHDVLICHGAEVIARHARSYERDTMIFDPLHYLPLIEQKVGSLDQAAPLANWVLPAEFLVLRRLMESRLAKAGSREYVGVLRLLEGFSLTQVHQAVLTALRLGAISYDGVKHCLLAALDGRPPRLDLAEYPHLPVAMVATTDPGAYNDLLLAAAESP
ncbi:MAG: IS21 family transposase [Planctomycetes bacterium]|nr:IS21 family transposase [Planctomycetota bacterium]